MLDKSSYRISMVLKFTQCYLYRKVAAVLCGVRTLTCRASCRSAGSGAEERGSEQCRGRPTTGCLVLQNAGEGSSDRPGFGAKAFSHFGAGRDVLGQAWGCRWESQQCRLPASVPPTCACNDPPARGITGVQESFVIELAGISPRHGCV